MLEKKELASLIMSGFDLELISFEFDIPIEQVRQCKKAIDQNKFNNKNKSNKENLSLGEMRKKYRQLYWGDNRDKIVQPKPLSQEEIELIDTVLATVSNKIKEMEGLGKKEKRNIAQSIYLELKKIPEHQMPLEQAKKFYKLMCSKELIGLNLNITDRIDYFMKKQRFRSLSQFADAIDLEQDKCDDIEEFQRLCNLITIDMLGENNVIFGAIKSKILNKITSIQQQKAVDKIKNDIPESIKSIISDLARGEIDIQKANAIIDEEADRRLANRPPTRFAIATTKEGERKQVFYQISTAIEENAEAYPIENPETTISHLQKLFGGKLEQSVKTVVCNLIARKHFNEAKNICDKFAKQSNGDNIGKDYVQSRFLSYIRGLKDRVRNAEIGDIVMTAMETQRTPEEERAYFKFIKKSLEEGNIKPSAISLGKSKDGKRNITLADIWGAERTR